MSYCYKYTNNFHVLQECAGMYCMSRYATDIGVRSDVVKVGVEDLAVNLGWTCSDDQEEEGEVDGNGTSNSPIIIE
jgi:hypothetical protein